MRIGFDLDGVLANLHEAFSAEALRLFPDLDARLVASPDVGASPPADDHEAPDIADVDTTAPPAADPEPLALSHRQTEAVWRRLCDTSDFWETLPETEPGIVARLAALAEERRWEVIFLTSRPPTAGGTVQRQSQRWLDRKGFPLPSVFVVHGSRGRIAESLNLDVVVDDRPENCLDVALESKARAVLVWRSAAAVPPTARQLGIGVEPTVAACLDVLIEADRSADTPADLMQRLRRLLGLLPKKERTKVR
jgi:hypothetical protein